MVKSKPKIVKDIPETNIASTKMYLIALSNYISIALAIISPKT
jgi:hypothetical protein